MNVTDDELIDAYHKANLDRKVAKAGSGDLDETFRRMHATEIALIERFGLGEHLRRYKERYP